MTFIPVPHSAQLCFDFITAGQNWQFCLVVKKNSGDPSVSDLGDLAQAGADWHGSDLRDLLSTVTNLKQTRATDLTVQGGPEVIHTVGNNGTIATASAPLNAALVVSARTDLRGRSYRGRAYVSGFPASFLNNAVDMTSTYSDAFATAFGALADAIQALGFAWVIASKQHNGAVVNPAATNPVTTLIVDPHLDSQRRRLYGRGT